MKPPRTPALQGGEHVRSNPGDEDFALPSWKHCATTCEQSDLEWFIYKEEPSYPDNMRWRQALLAGLKMGFAWPR